MGKRLDAWLSAGTILRPLTVFVIAPLTLLAAIFIPVAITVDRERGEWEQHCREEGGTSVAVYHSRLCYSGDGRLIPIGDYP